MPSAKDVAQFYLPLPVELIREIITNVDWREKPTLAALALVSKTFHNLVTPHMYYTVCVENEREALSLVRSIKAAHALSVDNAKYIVVLTLMFDDATTPCFDDVMSLPGLNPQTLLFEIDYSTDNVGQIASSWEARPKCMGLRHDSFFARRNPWVCQRMALFSRLTHLYLEEEFHSDGIVSFCLELRTLTHICVPIHEADSEEALRVTHLLLGMPSMELVLIYAAIPDPDNPQLNDMGFPKGDVFPLLAEIPDERLYVYPEVSSSKVHFWFLHGVGTPWDLSRRRLTMPWREAVRAS